MNSEAFIQVKVRLFNGCLEYINKRISAARVAIEDIQASADEETKSSAGDKYETGRAMMQLEMEKTKAQWDAAVAEKNALQLIPPDASYPEVRPGSLVLTNQGNFYIAIGAGRMKIEDADYYLISPGSPIGIKLTGLRAGDRFTFNTKEFRIDRLY